MKKLLYLLIPLLFFSTGCEDENSSDCGAVDVTINGESRNYNPMSGVCGPNSIMMGNGNINITSLMFISICDGYSNDYSISVVAEGPSFYITEGIIYDYGCDIMPSMHYFSSSTGNLSVSDINYSNNTISGSISMSSNAISVYCDFSDVPFSLTSY
tara:strand:+ start:75 stop:542 length:468 start_codon:yes stop_codon:yes gene_type:complete